MRAGLETRGSLTVKDDESRGVQVIRSAVGGRTVANGSIAAHLRAPKGHALVLSLRAIDVMV